MIHSLENINVKKKKMERETTQMLQYGMIQSIECTT